MVMLASSTHCRPNGESGNGIGKPKHTSGPSGSHVSYVQKLLPAPPASMHSATMQARSSWHGRNKRAPGRQIAFSPIASKSWKQVNIGGQTPSSSHGGRHTCAAPPSSRVAEQVSPGEQSASDWHSGMQTSESEASEASLSLDSTYSLMQIWFAPAQSS